MSLPNCDGMTDYTDILIIRHGQTDWNKQKKLQGHSDIPLNEEGRKQAETLARILKNQHLDAIYSSDLKRAYETALEIAKVHRMPVTADRRFRERCYGACEGLRSDEIREKFPEEYKAWVAAAPDLFFPDGKRKTESPRQFHSRARDAVVETAKAHLGQTIAIITHFGVLETAYREAKGIPLGVVNRMPVLNTSINRFRWYKDGRFELTAWQESEHLEEAKKPPVDYLKHF